MTPTWSARSRRCRAPAELVAVATKSDLVTPDRMAEHLMGIAALEGTCGIDWAAHRAGVRDRQHDQLDVLADALVSLLPEGPPLYPDGEITDEPEETLVAELIREAALEGVRDELPHSITVAVEEMGLRRGPAGAHAAARHLRLDDRRAGLAEGHHHRPPRQPGCARSAPPPGSQIEALLGTPVYLDLRVKVLKEWQRDPKHLNRLVLASRRRPPPSGVGGSR